MTSFDDEFGGHTIRTNRHECWTDGHGEWHSFGTGIEPDGTTTPLAKCGHCGLVLCAPTHHPQTISCGFGPVYYRRDTTDDENAYVARLIERLETTGWKIVAEEVKGRHITGRRLRVDLVIEPPDPWTWHDRAPRFAVECKRHYGSTKDVTKVIWQAIDYAHTEWDGHGHLPVLITPAPWLDLPYENNGGPYLASVLERVLGRGRIGAIQFERKAWRRTIENGIERTPELLTVTMNGEVLWRETQGAVKGQTFSVMAHKVGSSR